MGSGPVCAMVWEGREAVKVGRQLLGATNPMASSPGTIRGDFAIVSLALLPSPLRPGENQADLSLTTGRRPQRLPWLRRSRVSEEGDRPLVQEGGDQQLEAGWA